MLKAEFVRKLNEIHGNDYSYELIKNDNVVLNEKIAILCKLHGKFEQRANNHLYQAQKCPYCKNPASTQEFFIKEAIKKFGDGYDYSKVVYVDSTTKVTIVCKTHGEFKQTPNEHLRTKFGLIRCNKCNLENSTKRLVVLSSKNGKANKNSTEKIILQFNKTHGSKYDYSLMNYVNLSTKIKIICNIHGTFEQTPQWHRAGNGCPVCNESKGEKEIAEWMKTNNIEFIREKSIPQFNPLKKFDFFLPKFNVYIEYDGIQHFKPKFGNNAFEKQRENDLKRNKWCQQNNVNLLLISYLDCVETKLKEIF